MTIRISRASVDDVQRCAELLGAAFAEYPWTRWCVDADDHVHRITELQRNSLEILGLAHGLVWVVEEVDGKVLAVAVWTDSRAEIDRSLFIELADRSRPWHGNRLTAAVEAESGATDRPSTPHLFLETMGTHPDHQRCGYGSMALRPGLALADRSGLRCGLETSTTGNVEFYRTLGFEITAHRVVADGGPDVWTMWRRPRPIPRAPLDELHH